MKQSIPIRRQLAGGVIALAALLTAGVGRSWAQTTPMTTPAPTMMSGNQATLLVDEGLDYSKLYNPNYDYFDIVYAKSQGCRDDDVAKAVKIAEKTRMTMRHACDLHYVGYTWTEVADEAGLPHNALKNVDKEKDEVAAYEAAFLATGYENQRRDSEASIRAQAMYGNRGMKK